MSSSRITAGERRGLIALIVVLCLVTGGLCLRDYTCGDISAESGAPAMTVPADSVLDSVHVSQRGAMPLGAVDSVGKVNRGRRRSSARKPKASSGSIPQPRHPRDERVD